MFSIRCISSLFSASKISLHSNDSQLGNFGDWQVVEPAKPPRAVPVQPNKQRVKEEEFQDEEVPAPHFDGDLDSDRPLEELLELHNAWRLSR